MSQKTLTTKDYAKMQKTGEEVMAANQGTSEGVAKAWETRHGYAVVHSRGTKHADSWEDAVIKAKAMMQEHKDAPRGGHSTATVYKKDENGKLIGDGSMLRSIHLLS